MADREVHTHTTSGGGSGFGIVGVIVGALLVLGAIFLFAGGGDWFKGGSGSKVTINAPSLPATSGSK